MKKGGARKKGEREEVCVLRREVLLLLNQRMLEKELISRQLYDAAVGRILSEM